MILQVLTNQMTFTVFEEVGTVGGHRGRIEVSENQKTSMHQQLPPWRNR